MKNRLVVMRTMVISLVLSMVLLTPPFSNAREPSKEEVQHALRKAVEFYRNDVSGHGGYLWKYSADLQKKEGEGKVGDTTAWLQPPGTPYIGETYLDLYELTGNAYYLGAAKETAMALVKGQLHSGGWDKDIQFDPKDRKRYAYRVDSPSPDGKRNRTTLDDDKTQSALRFLTRYDKTANFEDETIHEAVIYGLDKLIEAQFPNGAWPHGFTGKPDPSKHPIQQADYKEDGEYTRIKEYWNHYTLNDHLQSDVIDTLALAVKTYEKERYMKSLKKAGDFLLLAQMPQPQPGWAQQYDYDMHPAWARKFEPAAITGGESQTVMMTLMDVYELTGEKKYLETIPKALAYYKSSLLPDGRLARFYELKTNKPLYFTKDYQLTYSDDDMPTHYGFKVGSNLDRIEKRYNKLADQEWPPPEEAEQSVPKPSAEEVREIINAMDERGAWVEEGRMRYWGDDDPTSRVIDPRTFVRNAITLARYIDHAEDQPETISVAAIQFKPRGSVRKNTEVMIDYLKQCADQNIRIAVFQECATTGYDKEVINAATEKELLAAERKIAQACNRLNLYALVGTPHFKGDSLYNTAVVFDPDGKEVVRYSKIQLVGGDDWAEPGDQLYVFPIDGIPCSIIICHDERYPELTRLQVLAGARLVFYPSSESSVTAEHKLDPYRAQIAARADENDVYIVQANEPAMASHGQSRIIAPDGNLLGELGMFEEGMLTATLDLSKASGHTAKNSLRYNKLKSWWKEGIDTVEVLK